MAFLGCEASPGMGVRMRDSGVSGCPGTGHFEMRNSLRSCIVWGEDGLGQSGFVYVGWFLCKRG